MLRSLPTWRAHSTGLLLVFLSNSILGAVFSSNACAQDSTAVQSNSVCFAIRPTTSDDLREVLRYRSNRLPIVSAHRGGAQPGYPENCIPTFEKTVQSTFAMLEVDPRRTKDGHLVIHHDTTLERTTTGTGKLADRSLSEIKLLRLRDSLGQVTDYTIPTLEETFLWARGKTVLVLDQKDVSTQDRVQFITDHHAEAFAMVIVNTFHDATVCYQVNPKVMMEAMIPNRQKVLEFDRLGIPWRNVVAFVGHQPPDDPELYRMIHDRGALCMIGTSRNLDRQLLDKKINEIRELRDEYQAFLDRGADLIETDIPTQLGPLMMENSIIPDELARFLSRAQSR